MANTPAFSYKNVLSMVLSLATTLFLIVVVLFAVSGGLAGLTDPMTWTAFVAFVAIVGVFTSFIEASIIPRMKRTGLFRTLFVYWALGTFLAVVLVAMLFFMSPSGEALFSFAIVGLFCWMLYVINIALARTIYPLVHKSIWKRPL